jgi:protein-tyrosine phosphatase
MAMTVVRHHIALASTNVRIEVDSAGTHSAMVGERPDPRAVAALTRRGYVVGRSRSRQVETRDFSRFDRILAMDASNLASLTRQCPANLHAKLELFLSYAPELGLTDMPDPYYGNAQGFERVLDLCEAGAKGFVARYTL